MSKKDIQRLVYRPNKDFNSVRNQQGRIQLDNDWDEGGSALPRYYGIHRGMVIDNCDPLSMMRLKVGVPGIATAYEAWALPCIPVGTCAVPKIGTGVWIMFEGGEIDHPVWLGTMLKSE